MNMYAWICENIRLVYVEITMKINKELRNSCKLHPGTRMQSELSGPKLLIWINFNSSMDKKAPAQ